MFCIPFKRMLLNFRIGLFLTWASGVAHDFCRSLMRRSTFFIALEHTAITAVSVSIFKVLSIRSIQF